MIPQKAGCVPSICPLLKAFLMSPETRETNSMSSSVDKFLIVLYEELLQNKF